MPLGSFAGESGGELRLDGAGRAAAAAWAGGGVLVVSGGGVRAGRFAKRSGLSLAESSDFCGFGVSIGRAGEAFTGALSDGAASIRGGGGADMSGAGVGAGGVSATGAGEVA